MKRNENEYKADAIIMEILKKNRSPLTMSAAMIVLEDGMCTQEVRLEEYIKVLNIRDALNPKYKDKQEYILSRNLPEEEAHLLQSAFFEVTNEMPYER